MDHEDDISSESADSDIEDLIIDEDEKPAEVVTTQKVETKKIPEQVSTPVKKKNNKSVMLTGRGVTTQMLIEEKILEAGENNLSINYLGNKFSGDLLSDGAIMCRNANQVFSSPSAWAMYCKKQINPDKKSGCGWASVKYKGRKLDEFKSTWFRKQKLDQAVAASSENKMGHTNDAPAEEPTQPPQRIPTTAAATTTASKGRVKSRPLKSPSSIEFSTAGYIPPTQNYLTFSEALKAVQANKQSAGYTNANTTNSSAGGSVVSSKTKPSPMSVDNFVPNEKAPRKRIVRTRTSVKHSNLTPNNISDGTQLVGLSQFQSTGKIQPFSLSISTNALLIMDFHCHLSSTEVSGYIAGKWNVNRQHLRMTDIFPCHYASFSSQEEIENEENKIRGQIALKGLEVLGWYHSHPYFQADPSIHDIRSQLQYQHLLTDGHYEPCVGIIVSPFEKRESQMNAFWVRAPVPNSLVQVGLPLSVRYTNQQDPALTQDVVDAMVGLVNFYQTSSDSTNLSEIWSGELTYLEKLKHSIIRKLPQDQTDGAFLDFIHKMAVVMS